MDYYNGFFPEFQIPFTSLMTTGVSVAINNYVIFYGPNCLEI